MSALVNVAIRQHNRIVYSTQAIHHISRQIECLYWDSVKREALLSRGESSGVEKGTNLTDNANIEKLPTDWQSGDVQPDENQRYRELRARLVELSQRREQQRQRLTQYTHVETLIEPFRDAQNNIQPNLLTRDGELLQELDKMRMLVARVTSRVGQSRPAPMEEVKEVHPSFLSASERLTKLMETT